MGRSDNNQDNAQELVHDEMEESHVIGCLLFTENVYSLVCRYLDDDCFYMYKYRDIWKAINKLGKNAIPIDVVSVTAELAKMDTKATAYDVVEAVNKVGTVVNVEYHAMRLKELGQRRKLWRIGCGLSNVGLSESEDIADVHKKVVDGINSVFGQASGVSNLFDAAKSLQKIIALNTSHTGMTGTPTGFSSVDAKGGLHKSDLIIVAGETSMGKTSLALSMTQNAIERGAKIAFYSMEMTKEQITARLLSVKTNIPSSEILYSSSLMSDQLNKIHECCEAMPGNNLLFDDSSTSNTDSILLSIRTQKLQHDIDGAVVDYLQILGVNSKERMTREQVMGDAARKLKNIAKELNIWIIAISQLSRDSSSPEPSLSRLRDSGQIAEAAGVVMLVYRPEYYNRSYPTPYEDQAKYPTEGTAMIDIAKGRNIGTFKFFLDFEKSSCSFHDSEKVKNESSWEPVVEDAPF